MQDIEYEGVSNPYAPPGGHGSSQGMEPHDPERSRGLVKYGIIGAVFLGFFPVVSMIVGIIGWRRAGSDLEKMARGLMSTEDGARGKTKAGLILGKINAIVGFFALLTLPPYYYWIFTSSFH